MRLPPERDSGAASTGAIRRLGRLDLDLDFDFEFGLRIGSRGRRAYPYNYVIDGRGVRIALAGGTR
ncbi:MAG: hypothetical protein H0U10_09140 [Chloroflexia bacterium]|nr:hypothetical protein [Chloroflexia bacterium]